MLAYCAEAILSILHITACAVLEGEVPWARLELASLTRLPVRPPGAVANH